jgi:SAM-dependent methyltransferase
MSTLPNYSSRFQAPDAVAHYEAGEYGAASYSSCVWQWQRPVVEKIVRDFRKERQAPVRLLDFACGTGRVTAALEPLADEVFGVDISENMVALARAKCSKSRFAVGDIFSQPELLTGSFDLVTAFRFLLNVEPEMRRRMLRRLREVIRPHGRLIVNVHGNSRSLRHPAIVWRRWRERSRKSDAMLNEMAPEETRQLLGECGFHVERQFGFGILPPTLYRTPLRGLAQALDRSLAGENQLRSVSIDLLFTCSPA